MCGRVRVHRDSMINEHGGMEPAPLTDPASPACCSSPTTPPGAFRTTPKNTTNTHALVLIGITLLTERTRGRGRAAAAEGGGTQPRGAAVPERTQRPIRGAFRERAMRSAEYSNGEIPGCPVGLGDVETPEAEHVFVCQVSFVFILQRVFIY